jgi:Ca-activated chloride channel family protein
VTDHPHDSELDALLREVQPPAGFLERLKDALSPCDERLDESLRAVVVPAALLSRLKEIPADSELDQSLVDLPAPLALIHDLRKPTWRDRLRRIGLGTQRAVLAASWFVAVSATLAILTALALFSVLPQLPGPLEMVVIYDGPFTLDSVADEPPVALVADAAAAIPAPGEQPEATEPIARRIEPDLTEPPGAGPVAQWVNLVSAGLRPLDDAVLLRYGVLGAPQYADDRLPELIAPRLPRPTGIEPPLVRGYDRPFFLKNRVFPPISPRANPQLAALDVPLITYSDVLWRLERSLTEDKMPKAADVRAEELLAAMDHRLPPAPAGKLAVRTAAGPSLFGGPEVGLLQVGVQAGALAIREQAATHLVLAIDLSHSMGSAGRLEMLQSAIGRLIDQLAPRDRLSIVLFDEEVRSVVEAATRGDAESLRAMLDSLSPRGGTNLAAGLQQAVSLAMSDAAGSRAARRLVLITDSEALLTPEATAGIEHMLDDAAAIGVRLNVLDVSYRDQIDPLLARWSIESAGDWRRIADARQLYQELMRVLSGSDPAVAHDARLTLRFNPKTVAAYRLVGHEANALADVAPAAIEAEILAGEAATALVELWFTAEEADDLGTAELTWNDPATGQSQSLRQRISRVQFAATAQDAPLPLLQAALAAQVGEVLHGSDDVLRQAGLRSASSRGLEGVLAAAERLNPRLRERADVVRLLDLARRLERAGVN